MVEDVQLRVPHGAYAEEPSNRDADAYMARLAAGAMSDTGKQRNTALQ